MIIYRVTNKINGKQYIGQTIHSFEHRKSEHISKSITNNDKMYFHRAIKKYGKEAFKWDIIHACDTIDMLNFCEKFYIGLHNTMVPNGYNLKEGGKNAKCSKETKVKLSKSLLGYIHTDEAKKNMSKASKGRVFSEETRRKLSEANKGNKSRTGQPHTEETKLKISKAHLGKVLSEEHKRNLSKAHLGKVLSEEHKKKLSKSHIGKKHSEESKLKMSKSGGNRKGRKHSEETKLKMSESAKKNWKDNYQRKEITAQIGRNNKGRKKKLTK